MMCEPFGPAGNSPGASPLERAGWLELAEGGTLFLNGVDYLSPGDQISLLRALDTRMFRSVDGERNLELSLRVISSSDTDLETAVTLLDQRLTTARDGI